MYWLCLEMMKWSLTVGVLGKETEEANYCQRAFGRKRDSWYRQ